MRLFCLFFAVLLSACEPAPSSAPVIVSANEALRVIVKPRNDTFWDRPWGLSGLDLELAQRLAHQLDRELELIELNNDRLIVETLAAGQADLAAVSLPMLERWTGLIQFSDPLLSDQYVLAYHPDDPEPEIEKLAISSIAVSAQESALAFARSQKALIGKLRPYPDQDAFSLMRAVAEDRVPLALVQTAQFDLARAAHLELESLAIGDAVELGWGLGRDLPSSVKRALNNMIGRAQRSGELDDVVVRHLPGQPLDGYAAQSFDRHIRDRLSVHWQHFADAGAETQQDPLLLAAIGYQESHWRRRAKSPTGVRGVMMLTLPTAKEMGVTNRLDARQSIFGGAQYLLKIRERFDDEVTEPDRTWLALAAYNLGWGHVSDIRAHVASQGGDPNDWETVRAALPLKTQREIKFKNGRARGNEAVAYVDNIRNYYNALLLKDSQDSLMADLRTD